MVELAQKPPKAPVKVKKGTGWGGEIEAAWLRPVIKSPREITRLVVRLEDLRYLIFMPSDDGRRTKDVESYLAQEYLLAYSYIQWGKKQGYHERPTCAGREFWWDVGKKEVPSVIFRWGINDCLRVFAKTVALIDRRRYEGFTNDTVRVVTLCNSKLL